MLFKEKQNRPIIKIELDSFDRIIEGITYIGLLILWVIVASRYKSLPDIIPTHFDVKGVADDYGSKSTIWLLPAISTVLVIVLALINLKPHNFNLPVKITQENAERQYRLATKMIRFLKLSMLIVFGTIAMFTINVSETKDGGTGYWMLFLILGATFVPLGIYMILAFRKS